MKKVLIVGASGMIGGLVLENCIKAKEITEVTIIVRRSLGIEHPKLKEIIHQDYTNYATIITAFKAIDLAFFCIGAYTGVVNDEKLKLITVDFAISFGKTLKKYSPNAVLCFLSGQGADRAEKSRMAFAKYKGMAENTLDKMEFTRWHSFRPGYIYPVTPRKEPNAMYKWSRKLYPLIKLFGKNTSITSTELAKVMFIIGMHGDNKTVLENRDMISVLKK